MTATASTPDTNHAEEIELLERILSPLGEQRSEHLLSLAEDYLENISPITWCAGQGEPGEEWFRRTTTPMRRAIAFGERLRLAFTREQLASFAYANGIGVRPDLDAVSVRKSLEGAFSVPRVQTRIGTHVFFVWMPGQTLPSDWPADDAHLSDGWHVEMVYGVGWLGSTPLPTQTPPDLSTADLRSSLGRTPQAVRRGGGYGG